MASRLLSIPAELLASIADELDLPTYGNLRLCCKQAEEYTFTYFAKKFFGRRKFFRGHLSLSTLLTISESRLAPYLETVILSTVLLDREPPCDSETVSREAYFQAYAEQTNILASGWDRDMLTAALGNLPNLIGIGTEVFDDTVTWDDDTVQTTSESYGGYGLKTTLRNLRIEPGSTPSQSSQALRWVITVQLLLAAAARANVRPRSFCITGNKGLDDEIYYYSPSCLLGVDDDAFHIPSFMREMILPVVEGLEEIDLHVHNRNIEPLDSACCRTSQLREFLGIPKRLEKLRIHRLYGGEGSRCTAHTDDFWTWLGQGHKGKDKALAGEQETRGPGSSGSNAMVSPPPIALPHLQELEINSQHIQVEDLTRLLKKVSPTLRKISLHRLILRDRESDSSEEEDEIVKNEVEQWAGLCGKMAALPWESLYEVSISGFGGLGNWHLSQFDCNAGPDAVHFKRLRMSGEDMYSAVAEFSYRGPDTGDALRQLADELRAALRDGRQVFSTSSVGTRTRRRSF